MLSGLRSERLFGFLTLERPAFSILMASQPFLFKLLCLQFWLMDEQKFAVHFDLALEMALRYAFLAVRRLSLFWVEGVLLYLRIELFLNLMEGDMMSIESLNQSGLLLLVVGICWRADCVTTLARVE